MSTLVIVLIAIVVLGAGYVFYGRHIAKKDKFGNSFGNTIIYHISNSEQDYRRACIDYIAGMTDTYAEKIFDELTTF